MSSESAKVILKFYLSPKRKSNSLIHLFIQFVQSCYERKEERKKGKKEERKKRGRKKERRRKEGRKEEKKMTWLEKLCNKRVKELKIGTVVPGISLAC